ncbi:ABC transporter substrate-binding protein [Auraticoccus monumenti]|uniref:ABC transporter substrate-binding protein n=1 Tax=Auraticoccus monumenti TaxID=675864 RepID=UPI001E2D91C5|nr:ABC transporter substrate-binding protein [Auraticoccus monumenti]
MAGTTGLAACGRPVDTSAQLPDVSGGDYDGPPITLQFWNGLTGGDGPVMRKLLAEFTAAHPAITVEMYAIPWSNFYQKFPAAVVSGLAPDLGLMHNFQVATNAARQVIVPLDPLAEALELTESDYLPVVWGSGLFQGERWSLPLDMWPDSLFYNRRVLADAGLDPDAPPTTGEEYLSALETLRSNDIQGHWLPAIDPQGVGRGFDSLLWQMGGELYDAEGGQALFGSEAGIRALEWQQGLIDAGYSPTDVSGSDGNVAFKNDQNAFIWGGPGALINDLAKVEDLDWDVAPLPRIGPNRAAFSGSHQFVLMRQREFDPDRISAVVTFLRWITDNSIGWASAGPVPARLPVLQQPEFAELEAQSHVAEGVEHIRFYPLVPGIAEVQTTILYPAIGDALLGQASPADALARATEQASFLLSENLTKYREVR